MHVLSVPKHSHHHPMGGPASWESILRGSSGQSPFYQPELKDQSNADPEFTTVPESKTRTAHKRGRPLSKFLFFLFSLHSLIYIHVMGLLTTHHGKRENASQYPAGRADLVGSMQ